VYSAQFPQLSDDVAMFADPSARCRPTIHLAVASSLAALRFFHLSTNASSICLQQPPQQRPPPVVGIFQLAERRSS